VGAGALEHTNSAHAARMATAEALAPNTVSLCHYD
jgi:hypothetical protein